MLATTDETPLTLQTAAEPVLQVKSLTKFFVRSDNSVVPAVDNVDMEVYAGEFVVLLGPSGCGKTTLLRCIGGLERPDHGFISVEGKSVYSSQEGISLLPEVRHVGMVFQSYALWPHMTVFDNVAYPLRARKTPRAEIAGRVREALIMVGIPELEKQYPSQMSGGQQQRVALARAIVSRSRLILFDEPLSNVDAKVREQLREELVDMQQKLKFAAVYVTHDQEEAMALAHRIAALRKGKVAQIGAPRDLYLSPRSLYVANFIGKANTLPGRVVTSQNGRLTIETSAGQIAGVSGGAGFATGDGVVVIFRPERCSLSSDPIPGYNALQSVLESSRFMGPYTQHTLRTPAGALAVHTVKDTNFIPGQKLWVCGEAEYFCVLPAE